MEVQQLDTPALLVDVDKVAENIQLAITYAGGANRLRPHVKTHKILEVAKMQIAAGIEKFKCATIAEAEMLGLAGAKDVLLAYPVQGPKIKRVLALQAAFPGTEFAVLIDNLATARHINTLAGAAKALVRAFIDLNVGQSRTGILPSVAASLVEHCQEFGHLKVIGLHAYDGHLHQSSLPSRTEACRAAFGEVDQLRKQLNQRYARNFTVVAGGSPTFPIHAKYHNVECSPGTFIFWDQGYQDNYPEQAFKKAAVLVTRVISKIDPFTYCLDLGHKSVASEMPFPRVRLVTDLDLTQTSHSEEHLVVTSPVANVLEPGQLLLAYPYHICPTVALYDQVVVVRKELPMATWDVIARDRKITI